MTLNEIANRTPGIYLLRNTTTGQCYIGQATDLKRRIASHFNVLKARRHPNALLQKSYDEYGRMVFEWEILEKCQLSSTIDICQWLCGKEAFYIKSMKPELNQQSAETFSTPQYTELRINDQLLTTSQAAKILGVSTRRVQAMIKAKRLPFGRLGKAILIKEKDLEKVKDRKPGRPRK